MKTLCCKETIIKWSIDQTITQTSRSRNTIEYSNTWNYKLLFMKILFCISALVTEWQCHQKRVNGFTRHCPAFRMQSTIYKSGTFIFSMKLIHQGFEAPFLIQVLLCQVICKTQSGVAESFSGRCHNIPTSGPAIESCNHLAQFVAAADPRAMCIFCNPSFDIKFVLQNLSDAVNAVFNYGFR